MKTKHVSIIMLLLICCLSWSVNAIAAQYDPTVERVQLKLTALNYEPGPADGKMGKKTAEALKKYQEENKLQVTGEPDEATLKKLKIGSPKVKCSTYNCSVEEGLTDDMVAQIKKHLSEEKHADEVILKKGTDTDLKKLPALNDGLVELRIASSEYITNITPLGKLTNLEKVTLEYLDNVTDITPLSNLTELKQLTLRRLGEPLDPAPLKKLTNLEQLTLSSLNKEVEEPFDSSVMSGKPNLKSLTLYFVKVSDLSPVKDSPEMTTLYLEGITAEDLSPLTTLKKLTSLMLLHFPATDLSPVGELSELDQLGIRDVEITDLSFLKTLKKLKYLTLNNVPAKDLSPVGELTELRSMYFYSTTAFDDYSPLANCTKLETLQARKDTGFNKLEVIKSMPNLRTLYLEDNTEVQDWDALATATNLETLAVEGTSFTDLNLLKDMSKLSSLDVDKCTVMNVNAILDKPLRYVYIKDTKGIDDLTIFKDLPKLADLNIYHEKEQFPQEQIDALEKAKEEAKKKKQ